MEKPKVNLIHHINSRKSSKKIFLAGKFFIYSVVIIGLLVTSITYKAVFSDDGISENIGKLNIVGQIRHLIGSGDKTLRGEKEDRINILLLGIGGKKHEGGTLTDTNIIASIKPSTGEVAMLSIPRDLYVPLSGYDVWRKINSANSYGEYYNPGSGGEVAAKTTENVFNIPIHYYVRIDFDGFEKLIDEFKGIDIYVENTLNDYKYPIRGNENVFPYENRFEYLRIDKGWQHMNGELALKYVRSRHALGIEGSDFARSRRQQKVLSAVKNKILRASTFFSIKKINSLLNLLNNNIATNMEVWEMVRFADMAKKINTEKIVSHVLDDGPNGLLYATITEDGAYVLKPKSNNWSELRFVAENIFMENPTMPSSKIVKTSESEKPKIITVEIQNGTKKNGFALKTSYLLKNLGYKILEIGNAEQQNYEKTIIYDLTEGQELKSLATLKKTLDANVALTLPGWLNASLLNSQSAIINGDTKTSVYDKRLNTQADFLIILGKNSIPIIFNNLVAIR